MMNSCSFDGEFAKTEQKVRSCLKSLVDWAAGRDEYSMSEAEFLLFLHCNDYDVKASKSNIESFLKYRSTVPEFFSYQDMLTSSELNDIVENVSVIVLPKCTPNGYFVVLLQLVNYEPNRFDYNKAVKYLNMVLDVHIYETGTSPGYWFIFDIKGLTQEHFNRLPDGGLHKFFNYLIYAAHFLWMGMRCINSDPDGEEINNYVKSKIADVRVYNKVFFHNNMKYLGKIVPKILLPDEMGGTAGHLQELREAQVKKILDVGKEILPKFERKQSGP